MMRNSNSSEDNILYEYCEVQESNNYISNMNINEIPIEKKSERQITNNIFDKNTVEKYKWIDNSNNISNNGYYSVSDYIKVDSSKNLLVYIHRKSLWYDKDNKLIEVKYTADFPKYVELAIPNNAEYVRLDISNTYLDVFKVELVEPTSEEYIAPKVLLSPTSINKFENIDFGKTVLLKNTDGEYVSPVIPASSVIMKNGITLNQYDFQSKNGEFVIYASQFNMVGDGVTDNSQAFLDIEAFISRNYKNASYGNYTVILPSGDILVKKDYLNLLSHKIGNASFGLCIKGQGVRTTKIRYEPEHESYFIKNTNKWGWISFEDFSFFGSRKVKTHWQMSIADPFPQSIIHRNISWKDIGYCYNLLGSDCNSEFTFTNCRWRGNVDYVLYSQTENTSEQFLNYSFYDCDYQVASGTFIHLARGGNVNVFGGCYIHKNSGDFSYPVNGGIFFELLNPYQAYGICRLLVIGARFECSVNNNSRLIYSEWGEKGNITFISCDDSAGGYTNVKNNYVEAEFKITLTQPKVLFQNCMLGGIHKYTITSGESNLKGITVYDNCNFAYCNNLESFIEITNNEVAPLISFSNMSGEFSSYNGYIPERNKVYLYSANKKMISLKTKGGLFPFKYSSKNVVRLPIGSIITKVILYAESNYCSAHALNDFTIYYGIENKKILIEKKDEKQYLGLNIQKEFFIPINSEDDCYITFESLNGDQPGNKPERMFALIEYI